MKKKIKNLLTFLYYKWCAGYCPHMCYKCEYKCEKENCKIDAKQWLEQMKLI